MPRHAMRGPDGQFLCHRPPPTLSPPRERRLRTLLSFFLYALLSFAVGWAGTVFLLAPAYPQRDSPSASPPTAATVPDILADLPAVRALLNELLGKVEALREELAALEIQREALRGDLQRLAAAQKQATRELHAAQSRQEELLAALAIAREELNGVRQQIDRSRQELLAVRQEHDELRERLAQPQRQIESEERSRRGPGLLGWLCRSRGARSDERDGDRNRHRR